MVIVILLFLVCNLSYTVLFGVAYGLLLQVIFALSLRTWLLIPVCFYCKPLAFVNHTFVLDKPKQMSLVSRYEAGDLHPDQYQ